MNNFPHKSNSWSDKSSKLINSCVDYHFMYGGPLGRRNRHLCHFPYGRQYMYTLIYYIYFYFDSRISKIKLGWFLAYLHSSPKQKSIYQFMTQPNGTRVNLRIKQSTRLKNTKTLRREFCPRATQSWSFITHTLAAQTIRCILINVFIRYVWYGIRMQSNHIKYLEIKIHSCVTVLRLPF